MSFTKYGAEIARDFGSPGVPASGAWDIVKADLRAWMRAVETEVGAVAYKGAWLTATAYAVNDVVQHGGVDYIATAAHTSGAASEPGTGVDWEDFWEAFGQALHPSGSAAAPGIAFGGDPDTGLYGIAANVLGISTGGTGRIRVDSAALAPVTNDGVALGTASLGFSDYFGAAGHVFDLAGGDYTVTHSTGNLAFSGAIALGTDLAVADGGTGASDASTARSNLGVAIGSDVQAWDADLDALAGISTAGLLARTGAGTAAARTLTGTAGEIDVADGDGASGNPTLSLPSALDLSGKTVTLGALAGAIDMGAATSLEIPNSAAPTLDAAGEIGIDTSVTDFADGVLKYFAGSEMAAIAVLAADLAAISNGDVPTYDAATDRFILTPGGSAGGGFTTVNVQVFTSNGTYTPTSGMAFCLVFSTGGGGGGGGADSDGTSDAAAGSAGAGATCIQLFDAATIGTSQTVTIGAAGTAGADTGTNGGNGGDTTFGALHTAGGGVGGTGIAGTASHATAGGDGGVASGGLINLPGGSGSGGVGESSSAAISGPGGASFWGGGAGGVALSGAGAVAGKTATVPGAGGSGAANRSTSAGAAGGSGAPGICVVIEFII